MIHEVVPCCSVNALYSWFLANILSYLFCAAVLFIILIKRGR
ncbi:hypothetical protein HMPREF1570_4939 [Klebsiella oxytoca KA-2]|nr:hypothetical protein HMPREF1570_4939 [Klebsiella oxytoca KA-2]EUC90671.1 hypothetical protein HMPREF1569_4739 [Klebsiella oxytoca OK-1]